MLENSKYWNLFTQILLLNNNAIQNNLIRSFNYLKYII